MKRFLILALSVISIGATAQKYEKVQMYLMFSPAQSLNAKAEIDKIATEKPKALDKAEYWLWKARTYSAVFNDSTLRATNAGAISTAWEAFSKYVKMDPELKLIKDDAGSPGLGMTMVDQIYMNTINIGLEHFKKEQWPEALDMFQYSYNIGDFITHNDLRGNKQAYDTLTVLYAGYAAQNSKKIDDALKYYSILTNSKIKDEKYLDQYKFVLITYSQKKDSANFYQNLAIAKEVFPKEGWDEFESDYINRNYTVEQKLSYYNRHDALNDMSAMQYFGFGDDFTNPSADDKKSLDSLKQESLKEVGIAAYKKAYTKDNKLALAAFNVGVLTYNIYSKMDDKQRDNLRAIQEINTKKAEIKDPAKKKAFELKNKVVIDSLRAQNAAIENIIIKPTDESIEWLEKAYNALKGVDKRTKVETNCLNKSVDLLANLFTYRRDKVRVKDPKAFDAFDAKYKVYDALHDKF